ncbi:MAG: 30S ribosomal protein S20 [Elusimicrobiota bacterium]|jgi:small subunit ribosomal protein S20
MAAKKKPTRHASALKAHRQSLKRYSRNRAAKKAIRLSLRAAVDAGKDPSKAGEMLAKASSCMDRAAQRGTIHWKTAARKKSRLAKRLAAIAAAPVAAK